MRVSTFFLSFNLHKQIVLISTRVDVNQLLKDIDRSFEEELNDDFSDVDPSEDEIQDKGGYEQDREVGVGTSNPRSSPETNSASDELREIKEIMLEVKDLLSVFIKQQVTRTPKTAGNESDVASSTSSGSDGVNKSTPSRTTKNVSLQIRVSLN